MNEYNRRIRPLPLQVQTVYADLLDRAENDAITETNGEGTFVSKTIKGRRYWYVQSRGGGSCKQKYIGPETPELLEKVNRQKGGLNDKQDQRSLVSALVSGGLPRPPAEIGAVVDALANNGVFRLGGVLLGTAAYQAYSGILGIRLTLYLDDGRIEMDTNAVERAMRPIKLNAKNALFAGCDDGAENWALLASFIETCKLNSVDAERWLADVLEKLVNGWPVARLDELLPWASAYSTAASDLSLVA